MKKEIKKSPFFAKLLEKQVKDSQNTKGGDKKTKLNDDVVLDQTIKYPSDDDEEYTLGWP